MMCSRLRLRLVAVAAKTSGSGIGMGAMGSGHGDWMVVARNWRAVRGFMVWKVSSRLGLVVFVPV